MQYRLYANNGTIIYPALDPSSIQDMIKIKKVWLTRPLEALQLGEGMWCGGWPGMNIVFLKRIT